MIIENENADRDFKAQFAACITENELRLADLLKLLNRRDYTPLGQAFQLFSDRKIEQALIAVRRGYHAAVGSDEAALFALSDILRLLPADLDNESISLADLPLELLHNRVSLLAHLNNLIPGKFSLKTLTTLEVEANCLSEISITRIGEHGANRIADLLYGSTEDQAFALDLLDRLHQRNVLSYDSCYPELLLAKARCKDKKLRDRVTSAMAYIESHNPTEVLPDALATVLAQIRSGENPSDALENQEQAFNLKKPHLGTLALAAADMLSDSGDQELAIHLLSAAAKYIGSDLKTAAWAGLLLGDKVHTAHAMFEYGLQSQGHPFFDRTERFHAVELACRLLYETHTAAAREELQSQADAYSQAGHRSEASWIRKWLASFGGFAQYIKARLEDYGEPQEDPDELRISQSHIAKWHYLHAIVENDPAEVVTGVEWFEKSALGNDAPWIEGERLLLKTATSSADIFKESITTRESRIRELETTLVRVAELIQSDYPIAVSLALRGLHRKSVGDPTCLRDLSIAARMLEPKTPELRHLREIIETARWDATTYITGVTNFGVPEDGSWREIIRLIPLLTAVADEDNRIRWHFAPYRHLPSRAPSVQLEVIRNLSDVTQRGVALEEFIVQMIESSPGLRVLDVRHRNSFEEIDIIVSSSKDDPMLSYWGPVLIIECKNWHDKVGTDPVRAFYTKMTTKKGAVRLGVLISASGFTKGVHEVTRLFQDALVVTLSLDDLMPVANGQSTFVGILRTAIPNALFA